MNRNINNNVTNTNAQPQHSYLVLQTNNVSSWGGLQQHRRQSARICSSRSNTAN